MADPDSPKAKRLYRPPLCTSSIQCTVRGSCTLSKCRILKFWLDSQHHPGYKYLRMQRSISSHLREDSVPPVFLDRHSEISVSLLSWSPSNFYKSWRTTETRKGENGPVNFGKTNYFNNWVPVQFTHHHNREENLRFELSCVVKFR